MPSEFELWTVYDHPKDFPGAFVARKFVGEQPTQEMLLAETIEPIRRTLEARGLVCITRNEADDPVIVESWL